MQSNNDRGQDSIDGMIKRPCKIMKLYQSILEKELKETGMHPCQHKILMLLLDCPDISQKELAKKLEVSTATMAVSLKKLEKAGYLSRAMDRRDNRFNQIRITKKGSQMVQDSKKEFLRVQEQMVQGFSKEELGVLNRMLDRVYNNLVEMF